MSFWALTVCTTVEAAPQVPTVLFTVDYGFRTNTACRKTDQGLALCLKKNQTELSEQGKHQLDIFSPLYSPKESLRYTWYLGLFVANNRQLQIRKQRICHTHLVRLLWSGTGIPCIGRNDNPLNTLLLHVLQTAL